MAQIQALTEEKAARSPAQRKLDSHIHYNAKLGRGLAIAAGVPSLPGIANSIEYSSDGLIHADITADVNPALLAAIAAAGGRVESSFVEYKAIRAWLPLQSAETLAGRGDVHFIRRADPGFHNAGAPAARPPTRQIREQNVRSQLMRALPAFAITSGTGADATGVTAHGADIVQAKGITGLGVKVGVLSNGVTSLATEQAAGRLPPNVTVVPGQSGNGPGPCSSAYDPARCPNEGTAMLEIVHALAPDALLFYATADGGEAQFAANIVALRTLGCDIIVDDVGYYTESVFQDGISSKAVNQVTASGAMYFSSSANSGNLDSHTSGTWEGDFAPGPSCGANCGTYHIFVQPNGNADVLTNTGGPIMLQWSDPFGNACDDYDLYAFDPTGTNIIDASTDTQDCSAPQNPVECVGNCAFLPGHSSNSVGQNSLLAIVLFKGSARSLHLDTNRGTLSAATSGNTHGHNAAAAAFTVAAVDVHTASGGQFTGGTINPPETFSSDGPRKIFFDPGGNALTPGNFLVATNGGTLLSKVDFTAADGVPTGAAGGFSTFFGTSAAAPHAAAIAALVKSAKAGITPAQIKNALVSTALHVSNFQARTVGAGILMANLAVASIAPNGPVLNITKTHAGNFTQGQTGATYTVTVSNAAGAGSTSGQVQVTETVPAGLILTGMTGPAPWACVGNACVRSDVLNPGSSYPPITVSVNVAATATSPQVNAVSVSGGGSATANATDSTIINTGGSNLTITGPASLPAGNLNQVYPATTVTATGGTGPYNWTATGLPSGLSIGPSTGVISGTPATAVGSPFSVLVRVQDTTLTVAAKTYSLTVTTQPPGGVVLGLGNGSAAPGQTVEIAMQMNTLSGPAPASCATDVLFDPQKLTFVSARKGETLTTANKDVTALPQGNNDVLILGSGINTNTIPEGNWAYIKFMLSGQFTSGTTPVTLKNCQASDSQAHLLTTACGASGTVSAGCSCDVDGVPGITIADIQFIINQFLANTPATCHAGNVNVADIQRIINAFLNLGCSQ